MTCSWLYKVCFVPKLTHFLTISTNYVAHLDMPSLELKPKLAETALLFERVILQPDKYEQLLLITLMPIVILPLSLLYVVGCTKRNTRYNSAPDTKSISWL